MTANLWIIPLLPALGAAINGLLGKRFSRTVVNSIALGSTALSFLWALKTVFAFLGNGSQPITESYGVWIRSGLEGCAAVAPPLGEIAEPGTCGAARARQGTSQSDSVCRNCRRSRFGIGNTLDPIQSSKRRTRWPSGLLCAAQWPMVGTRRHRPF